MPLTLFRLLLPFILSVAVQSAPNNTTCKKCHPKIFSEYQHSMHAQASVFKDPVHQAVWNRHPLKQKNNYTCATCHTPSDHGLISGKYSLHKNPVQQNEPISCQTCHTIQSIETHAKANKNIYTKKKKYFFSADTHRKGQKLTFKEEKRLFGLITKVSGSPYHTIDYSNENYYNGKMCLGCHDHKQNGKGFNVCDMQIKQGDSKETCISCHMPKVKGSIANQKQSATHAFHGISIHHKPINLARYIKLSLTPTSKGFTIEIGNEATHTLFAQPLRLAQLRVSIERGSQRIPLKSVSFRRIIGTQGKPAMPWLATEVIEDTTIKALEHRKILYEVPLHQGDTVVAVFGYYVVNPKAAVTLGITDPAATEFIKLKERRFILK